MMMIPLRFSHSNTLTMFWRLTTNPNDDDDDDGDDSDDDDTSC